eukprot:6002294-Alexandrium_andersonii.AAC.1
MVPLEPPMKVSRQTTVRGVDKCFRRKKRRASEIVGRPIARNREIDMCVQVPFAVFDIAL